MLLKKEEPIFVERLLSQGVYYERWCNTVKGIDQR